MFHIPGIFNFCGPHTASLCSFTYHLLIGCPRKGKRDYTQGRAYHVLFMLLFYTPQGLSENLSYSHFISCSLITLCFWGKIIYSFFSIHFPIKNIHLYLYSHSKFRFFFKWNILIKDGTGKQRAPSQGKQVRMCPRATLLFTVFQQTGHKDYLELEDPNKC